MTIPSSESGVYIRSFWIGWSDSPRLHGEWKQ